LAERVTYLYDVFPAVFGECIRKKSYGHILEGLVALSISRRFDVTITVGVGVAFGFGFVNRLLWRRRRHVVKELYFSETSLSSWMKRSLMRWALRDVDLVVTNSRGEIPYLMELLGLSREQFEFIPWPSELSVPSEPLPGADYVFAGGRSLRDWTTLFAAVAGTGLQTVVVATATDIEHRSVPQEVDLSVDKPYVEYLRLLQSARIVVVPVKSTFRSVGQIALLEAMALGKPVVAARVPGVADYLEPGVNGLLYEPGDVSGLRETLVRLYEDKTLQESLGRQAQRRVREEFNPVVYSCSMLERIARVCGVEASSKSVL
jgi:glycosyltransferase involved in cell wall biosynthesis